MDYDISQPLPSRSIGTQDAENRRIKCISDELRRRCGIHEAQPGTSQKSLRLADPEAQVAEEYAKVNGLWVPMDRIAELGMLSGIYSLAMYSVTRMAMFLLLMQK